MPSSSPPALSISKPPLKLNQTKPSALDMRIQPQNVRHIAHEVISEPANPNTQIDYAFLVCEGVNKLCSPTSDLGMVLLERGTIEGPIPWFPTPRVFNRISIHDERVYMWVQGSC